MERDATVEDVLRYCLAILNSEYAQHRLAIGHRPAPKGFYAITEGFLKEIPIPPPTNPTAEKILSLMSQLVVTKNDEEVTGYEKELAAIVNSLLGFVTSQA